MTRDTEVTVESDLTVEDLITADDAYSRSNYATLEARERLLSAPALKEFVFDVRTSDDWNSFGSVSIKVEAKDRVQAWKIFFKQNADIVPYIVSITLRKPT